MKKFGCFIILLLISLISYVVYSTKSIDKMKYRTIAWKQLSHGAYFRERFEYSLKSTEVKLINVHKENITPRSGILNKANYYLNQINCGYAVAVTFRIYCSNGGGPYTIYINPITKSIIRTKNTVVD